MDVIFVSEGSSLAMNGLCVKITFGWLEIKQCSQTFTLCSKQNKLVTFFFGHLHKPMIYLPRPKLCFNRLTKQEK